MVKQRRKHSKITLLPAEIRQAVEEKLESGETYQNIAAWIKRMGHDVSYGSVGRYGQDFFARLDRLKEVREQVKSIIEGAQGKTTFEMTEAAAQVAIQKILETLMDAERVEGESLTGLMIALSKLEQSGVAREKLKIELKQRADRAVENIGQAAKQKGLDEETLRIIKEQVYGIVG